VNFKQLKQILNELRVFRGSRAQASPCHLELPLKQPQRSSCISPEKGIPWRRQTGAGRRLAQHEKSLLGKAIMK
jgi:hypothetical protein